ncbi:MAG: UDP-3-O-[3-hydroxymyristoyl] N-acetylglucosamine deacetylase [Betaproteobacteria bacterium TMED82]|nr:MAG: UDP-3-O-[3-hydroxymyristoyl] N-acetylglucosamine deacetylase [Betaproteobacteria bacterium TMED82]
MLRQRTIQRKVEASGIGLHSGKLVKLRLLPAGVDQGVVFRRVDLEPRQDVKVKNAEVVSTNLASTISEKGVNVSTVEHFVAALSGLGIDNILVELDGPEVPIMDGSSATFVYLLKTAGFKEQSNSKKFFEVLEPVTVSEDDKWARVDPFFGFKLDFIVDFPHPLLDKKNKRALIDFESMIFSEEIARARTFGFITDVDMLRQKNLALGGGLDNAIVMDKSKILNKEGLRLPNELVMHKALDAIGDLYLIGGPILGYYSAYKSGHALNNKLVRTLLSNSALWRTRSFSSLREAPNAWSRQWSWE